MFREVYKLICVYTPHLMMYHIVFNIKAFFTLNYREISILWAIKISASCVYQIQILLKDYNTLHSMKEKKHLWEIHFFVQLTNIAQQDRFGYNNNNEKGRGCATHLPYWCISQWDVVFFSSNKSSFFYD